MEDPRDGSSAARDGASAIVGVDRSDLASDSAFLALIVLVSSGWYLLGLGFYSDDWALLAPMSLAPDQSLAGLYRALWDPWVAMRPAQLGYFSILYALFGQAPLGYHVVNTVVLFGAAVLLWSVMRELGIPRVMALSVAVLYVVLPSYSAVRFWFAAFGHLLSLALCLLSVYALLRSHRAQGRAWAGWLATSAVAMIVSALLYEVPIPYFAATALLPMALRRFRFSRARQMVTTGVLTLIVIGLVVFKWQTAVRFDSPSQSVLKQTAAIVERAVEMHPASEAHGLNLRLALETHFAGHAATLWAASRALLAPVENAAPLAAGAAVAVALFIHLTRLMRRGALDAIASRPGAARLFWGGWAVFWLGYAIFLTNSNLQFTLTGISNRANIGAAMGTAMVLVTATWAFSHLFRRRTTAYVVLIAIQAGACTTAVGMLAQHWHEAYRLEMTILGRLAPVVRQLPNGSTVLLDSVCPYVGPAIVFESNWDLAGALQLRLRQAGTHAGVATRLRLENEALATELYGKTARYPFGAQLFIYDYRRDRLARLIDRSAAMAYFRQRPFSPTRDCPPGSEGRGVRPW